MVLQPKFAVRFRPAGEDYRWVKVLACWSSRIGTTRHPGALKFWAEVIGFGMSSDAHHITQCGRAKTRDEMGFARCRDLSRLSRVCQCPWNWNAGERLDGDGGDSCDLAGGCGRLLMSSTKSMHGHTLGAAGGMEGVITVLSAAARCRTATVNFTKNDPACDLNVVPDVPCFNPVTSHYPIHLHLAD